MNQRDNAVVTWLGFTYHFVMLQNTTEPFGDLLSPTLLRLLSGLFFVNSEATTPAG